MIRAILISLVLAAAPCASLAQTVAVPPPVPSIIPPPPPAPPPPKIEVPPVPKLDAPVTGPAAKAPGRRSFNDRMIDCLDTPYAASLPAGERAAYSRACANRVN